MGALSLFSAPVGRWGGDGLLAHGAKEKSINPFTTGTPLFYKLLEVRIGRDFGALQHVPLSHH